MNVFEDLIEELREENLLEQTVIDLARPMNSTASGPAKLEPKAQNGLRPQAEANFEMATLEPDDGQDFYRKKAIDEVSSFQMVEHIISGIERDYLKRVPASYDDLEAQKALHKFLQVQGDPTTTEYAEAEFKLMHETESWSSALSDRDRKIAVSNLRRYCENSRPALSSQALMALGRFYRNAAFSELSRAKFDLVMTRLFSREIGDEKRRLLFARCDMIDHIKTLYAKWTSIALYSAEENSLKTIAVIAGFEDRIAEAQNAETFEQLIQNSFFDRIHEFKEATGEMFFTPEITAATIDCNVRIGNKFVDLIRREREKTHTRSLEQKYGYDHDQVISEAAGKTLQLVELLKGLPDVDDPIGTPQDSDQPRRKVSASTAAERKEPFFTLDFLNVNKWLLAATIFVVIISSGLYFWSSQPSTESSSAESAKDISLDGTELKDFLRSGRLTGETFYAITLPAWDQVTEEKKKEVLQQASAFANKNGRKNVRLVNVKGRAEAYATANRLEILDTTP